MDLEVVGRRIAEQRKLVRRISQEKMAEDLEMYQADVSALEHAKKGSGISDLNKLQMVADYLEIPLQELLFGSGKGSRMSPYIRKKSTIKWAGEKAKFTATNRKMLSAYYDIPEEKAHPVIYHCGNYIIYATRENLTMFSGGQSFGFGKIHLLVLFENKIIANLDAAWIPIFYFIHQPSFQMLQQMYDSSILDVSDVLRTLNPYIPLMQFSEKDKAKKEYRNKTLQRMEQLMTLRDRENILLVEELYVMEECRQKGIATMMLDAVCKIMETETVWLNMEPIEMDNFLSAEYGRMISPLYSKDGIRRISLNSGIAEMLGFTVDPDGWSRQIADIEDPNHSFIRNVRIRKTAYRLSPALEKILAHDGELVQRGRALQVMAQTTEEPDYIGDLQFRYAKQDGAILVELDSDTEDSLLGILTKDYEVKITSVTHGTLGGEHDLDLSSYNWAERDDLEDDKSAEAFDILEIILGHLEQYAG